MNIALSLLLVSVLLLSCDPNDFHWREVILGLNVAVLASYVEEAVTRRSK